MTVSQGELIAASWKMMIDENRNLRHCIDEREWKQMNAMESSNDGTGRGGGHTRRASDGTGGVGTGAAATTREDSVDVDGETVTTRAGTHINTVESKAGTQAQPRPSPSPTHKQAQSLTGPRKSNLVLVFELLLTNWLSMDPSVSLVWSNPRDAIGIITRMMQFFVKECTKFDTQEVQARIHAISLAHLHHNVSVHSYELLAKAVLITMKRVLGRDFTTQLHTAWVMAFSKFFLCIFPRHPPERKVLIKAAADADKIMHAV